MSKLVQVYRNSNVAVSLMRVDLSNNTEDEDFKVQYRIGKSKGQTIPFENILIDNIKTAVTLFNYYGGILSFTPSDTTGITKVYTTLTPEHFFTNITKEMYSLEENLEDNPFDFVATKLESKEKIFFLKKGLDFNLKTFQEWENILF